MLNRRQLLTLAGAMLAGGSPGAILAGSTQPAELSDIFADQRLSELGRRCLTLFQPDADDLLRRAGLTHSDNSAAGILKDFARRRTADFAAGRIHLVDGWVMAEAECALCALLALS